MKVPDIVSIVAIKILFGIFWVIVGPLLSPFWLLVVLVGVLIGVFDIEEAPRSFWELITVQWFFDN